MGSDVGRVGKAEGERLKMGVRRRRADAVRPPISSEGFLGKELALSSIALMRRLGGETHPTHPRLARSLGAR